MNWIRSDYGLTSSPTEVKGISELAEQVNELQMQLTELSERFEYKDIPGEQDPKDADNNPDDGQLALLFD
jgi:hypothetical protein